MNDKDAENSFVIISRIREHKVFCPSQEEKAHWIDQISKLANQIAEQKLFYDEKKMKVSMERASQAMAIIGDRYATHSEPTLKYQIAAKPRRGEHLRKYKTVNLYSKATPAEKFKESQEAQKRLSLIMEQEKKKEEIVKQHAEETKKKLQDIYGSLSEKRDYKRTIKQQREQSRSETSLSGELVETANEPVDGHYCGEIISHRTYRDVLEKQRENNHTRAHSELTLEKAEKSKKELEEMYGSLKIKPTEKKNYYEVMKRLREHGRGYSAGCEGIVDSETGANLVNND